LSNKERELKRSEEARLRTDGKLQKEAGWPEAFHTGNSLEAWRDIITTDANHHDPVCVKLRDELLEFEAVIKQSSPSPERAAEALYNLSIDAHRLWRDKTDQDFVNTCILWRDSFNHMVAKRGLPLKIRAAFPNEPFDIDYMVVSDGSSDSRLYVKQPLSWIILSDTNKVLHRGLMLTV
jgi:hypothetical protein